MLKLIQPKFGQLITYALTQDN